MLIILAHLGAIVEFRTTILLGRLFFYYFLLSFSLFVALSVQFMGMRLWRIRTVRASAKFAKALIARRHFTGVFWNWPNLRSLSRVDGAYKYIEFFFFIPMLLFISENFNEVHCALIIFLWVVREYFFFFLKSHQNIQLLLFWI